MLHARAFARICFWPNHAVAICSSTTRAIRQCHISLTLAPNRPMPISHTATPHPEFPSPARARPPAQMDHRKPRDHRGTKRDEVLATDEAPGGYVILNRPRRQNALDLVRRGLKGSVAE